MSGNTTQDVGKGRQMRCSSWVWALLVGIILLTAVVRVRLLDVPLERDEGHYAYVAQSILQGVPPYKQAYSYFMPGIYAAYALILAVFGQTHTGIHLGLLVVNAATILLVFLLAKKLFDLLTGVTAAAAFALLSVGQFVQGIFANAEHFIILPALGGILLVIRAVDSRKWLWLVFGSLLLGIALLMKQHGIVFAGFAGIYLFLCEVRRRPFNRKIFAGRCLLFLFGVLFPFAVTCLVLWRVGVFEQFWFWTFGYAREYVAISAPLEGLNYLKIQIIRIAGSAVLVWMLAVFGLTALCWNKKARKHSLFVVGFLIVSFLAVCPGFFFRPHYFILFLPAVALLAGIGISSVQRLFVRTQATTLAMAASILLALIVLLHAVYQQREFFFVMSPTMASRTTYGDNPFPESLEIARFIKEHSAGDDRIAIIGSEPQILFYSNRRSATKYIFTDTLMLSHRYARRMQEEMISEIESARPKFLIVVHVYTSWLFQHDSEIMILEWFDQYWQKYYQVVGIIDILSSNRTVYRWGREREDYIPRSKCWLAVLQRKDL